MKAVDLNLSQKSKELKFYFRVQRLSRLSYFGFEVNCLVGRDTWVTNSLVWNLIKKLVGRKMIYKFKFWECYLIYLLQNGCKFVLKHFVEKSKSFYIT